MHSPGLFAPWQGKALPCCLTAKHGLLPIQQRESFLGRGMFRAGLDVMHRLQGQLSRHRQLLGVRPRHRNLVNRSRCMHRLRLRQLLGSGWATVTRRAPRRRTAPSGRRRRRCRRGSDRRARSRALRAPCTTRRSGARPLPRLRRDGKKSTVSPRHAPRHCHSGRSRAPLMITVARVRAATARRCRALQPTRRAPASTSSRRSRRDPRAVERRKEQAKKVVHLRSVG